MDVRSAYTNQSWLTPRPQVAQGQDDQKPVRDEATEQIQRALSEVLRCQNLVVLAGLGTSLCVMDAANPPQRKAPTMAALWQRVKAACGPEEQGVWDALLRMVNHQEGRENIEELLSECKVAEAFYGEAVPKALTTFVALAEKEIRLAVNFLDEGEEVPVHGAFLRRIARRSSGKGRVKIFTTNYDLCFERAAQDGRFVVIDGFSPTLPPTFDPVYFTYDIVRRGSDGDASAFIPNVFHLYKLHGSIDWERCERDIEKKSGTEKPLLIYPRSSKYEQAFSQPYLEMMAALQAALREPNTGLLIVGFGFNDNHVAEPILSAIRSNLGLKVVVVDPALVKIEDGHRYVRQGGDQDDLNENGDLEEVGTAVTNAFINNIQRLIDQGDARLTLLNGTFEDMTREMPDLTAETDLEKHMSRLRVIEGGEA